MITLLVLGLLLVLSFVACYFCSKYWHWSHVLLTETVFLLSLAFFILAGEVFRIQRLYGEANAKNQRQIEQLEPQVAALKFGTENQQIIGQLEGAEIPVQMSETSSEDDVPRMLSVRDLAHDLGMVSRVRGRVWRDVSIENVDPATVTFTLSIPAPSPHGIANDTILYVFEQGDAQPRNQNGPQYIGDFRVTNTGDQQIQVQPASQFDQRAMERLQKTRGPWIMYENMPVDQHPEGILEILAGTTDEQLQQLLPSESVEEYLRHGGPAQPGDEDFNKVGYNTDGELVLPDDWNASTQFKYSRTLRDYNLLFQEFSKRYTQMEADHNALVEDNKLLNQALTSARKVQSMHEAEQGKLRQDVAGTSRDRQAIQAHQSQVETQLSNAQALLSDLLQQNSDLARDMGSSIE
ncbi:hypothetical protein NG895_08735 [Aeoliella sp. ICT_H6.2]|uniref:Uncharacterized protein n=1 Tax=Aeoliella straminimaris TaxID=2954799 RepID=A0A9X2JG43_9BACT|nr:hypothetical protein [Aeoliella straminimaris]MCO6043992.1 hypothetical protein [Aeoliella straminimaris]